MRYQDWDILLFPTDCKIPIKEFKVTCHVVHDAEFAQTHGSLGLPTVCCFIPSLPAGSNFQVSIHSWSTPVVSQFTRAYSEFSEAVKFEARLYIDGRLLASTTLNRDYCSPHVIAHTYVEKTGKLEPLRFPLFRRELLQQSHWSPADDVGRIKLILSEGFPRDSLSLPMERVKNVVMFSFQHAPLDLLEAACIAWPNASLWQRVPFTSSMPVPSYPSGDADSHAHSPRRRIGLPRGGVPAPSRRATVPQPLARVGAQNATSFPSLVERTDGDLVDPLSNKNAYFEWLVANGQGVPPWDSEGAAQRQNNRRVSTDISMPDYTPRSVGDQSGQSVVPANFAAAREEDGSGHLRVPTNTPTTSGLGSFENEAVPFPMLSNSSVIPADLASSLTNSLLNQPMPMHFQLQGQASLEPAMEVKSRKENRNHARAHSPSDMSMASAQDHVDMRRVSQQLFIPAGGDVSCLKMAPGDATLDNALATTLKEGPKRIRNFTPASGVAMENEDERQRCSSSVRLTPFGDSKENDG
ncbi:NADH dehydrogenase (ubiquinone)-like protein [Purpureocillium lilacinum]|uniref:NADH dehydrogenase (Ubiquinone)-like protein n=1 Tax=Purpureocillium lilacinum TaxID=33203 RepID=A0A179HBV9_PURLI|nr:NADH dehydrogenase (ubiquinone)-like protein [Purpureocillium lilacinum]